LLCYLTSIAGLFVYYSTSFYLTPDAFLDLALSSILDPFKVRLLPTDFMDLLLLLDLLQLLNLLLLWQGLTSQFESCSFYTTVTFLEYFNLSDFNVLLRQLY
jgi:hypothetical protein